MSTDELARYGVLGMRWGVRKDRSQPKEELILERKLKGGGKLIVNKNRPPSIVRALSKISPKYKANAEKFQSFTLRNAQGQKVGDAQIHQDTPTSLNLMWIGVKTAHRGNGYASAAVKGVVEYARQNGLKKLTLEVPGDAPDALHIYSKLGFKAVGNVEGSTKDDFWGGLTAMEYLIPDNALSHASIELQDILQYIEDALNENDPEQKTLSHSKKGDLVADLSRAQNFVSNLELVQMAPDELAHYGVLGMKWGIRKDRGHEGKRATKKKIASLDKKFQKAANKGALRIEIHNQAARKFNTIDLQKINNKPQYANADFTKNKTLQTKYEKEIQDSYLKRLSEAAKDMGTSASGTFQYEIITNDSGDWGVTTRELKHAEDDGVIRLKLKRNGTLHIIKITPEEDDGETLAHYGVLGMKWGRRKPESVARDARAERYARNTRRKLAVGTLGASVVVGKIAREIRKNRDATKARESDDHRETRELIKKALPELSNKEIDRITNRLQKEQQLKKLNPSEIQRGKKAVLGVIAAGGTAAGVYNLIKSPPGQAAIAAGTKAVRSAVILWRASKAFG